MPNLRRARNLPLDIMPLHLWHLHLVPGAYPPARKRTPEAEGESCSVGMTALSPPTPTRR
jgi:hypothetical protein